MFKFHISLSNFLTMNESTGLRLFFQLYTTLYLLYVFVYYLYLSSANCFELRTAK